MQRRGTAGEETLRPFPSSSASENGGGGGGGGGGGAGASDSGAARVGGLNGDEAGLGLGLGQGLGSTPPHPPMSRELSFKRKHRQAASCHSTPGSAQADLPMCTRAAATAAGRLPLPADPLASGPSRGHARSASHSLPRAASHASLARAAVGNEAAAAARVAKARSRHTGARHTHVSPIGPARNTPRTHTARTLSHARMLTFLAFSRRRSVVPPPPPHP